MWCKTISVRFLKLFRISDKSERSIRTPSPVEKLKTMELTEGVTGLLNHIVSVCD